MNQVTAEFSQQTQQKYQIAGVVDFETAPELMLHASGYFKTAGKMAAGSVKSIVIDMAQVTDCNSAGLPLMLEMVREAHSNELEVKFTNMPETLMIIAKAYGIDNEIRDICK